jgi:hypothetical protein
MITAGIMTLIFMAVASRGGFGSVFSTMTGGSSVASKDGSTSAV